MAIEDIQKMYDALYKSKYDELARQKEQSLKDSQSKEVTLNNQYKELNDKYNTSKLDTQSKYATMYTGLDNQKADASKQYYNDRNTVASQNARQTQQIRDYMANRNLLQSGESVDAMLRNNTDYNNSMANVYSNEQSTYRGIADKRNEYSLAEKKAYSDIDNAINAAERERTQKIQELLAYRESINNDFLGKSDTLKAEVDANRIRDINAYNEQLRQEAWKAEQDRIAWERQVAEQQRQEALAMSRASYSGGSGGSSGGYSSSGYTGSSATTNLRNDLQNEVLYSTQNMTNQSQTKNLVTNAYNQGYISDAEYNAYISQLNSSLNNMKKAQASVNKGTYTSGSNYSATSTKKPVSNVSQRY